MLRRLLGLEKPSNEKLVEAVYVEIVAAARRPDLYSRLGTPDTPLGRFEMLSLHLMLVLDRFSRSGEDAAVAAFLQDLTDMFFQDVEHSIRELGIGDMGVPKRMKRLARMFYGRAESYGAALRAGDRPALAAALARNVRPDDTQWAQADAMAGYALAIADALRSRDAADLLSGRLTLAGAEEAAP